MIRLDWLSAQGFISSAIWTLALAWLFLVYLHPQPLLAQSAALLLVEPSEAAMEAEEAVKLAIRVENAVDLYGVELRLVYDPAILQVVDADDGADGVQAMPGPFLHIDQGFLVANQADNERGQLLYAATLLAPAEPVAGDGILLEVSFRGIGIGVSSLDLDSSILASPDGQALPLEIQDGRITVGDSGPGALAPSTATAALPKATRPEPTATTTPDAHGQITASAQPTAEPAMVEEAPASTTEPLRADGQAGSELLPNQVATVPTTTSGPAFAADEPTASVAAESNGNTVGTDTEPIPAIATSNGDEGDDPLPNAITSLGDGTETEVEPAGDDDGILAVAISVLAFIVIAGAIFFGRRFLTRRG